MSTGLLEQQESRRKKTKLSVLDRSPVRRIEQWKMSWLTLDGLGDTAAPVVDPVASPPVEEHLNTVEPSGNV
jgi:hypothetical protein